MIENDPEAVFICKICVHNPVFSCLFINFFRFRAQMCYKNSCLHFKPASNKAIRVNKRFLRVTSKTWYCVGAILVLLLAYCFAVMCQ